MKVKTGLLLCLLLTAVVVLSGCVWYKGKAIRPRIIPEIEADAPSQSVPPAQVQQQEPPPPGALESARMMAPPADQSGSGMLPGQDWSGTINRFSVAYAAKKKPRIAVFLNRVLSDEVRDWAMGEGYVWSAETTGKGGWRGEKYYVEPVGGTGERPSPRETWMWAFEDGFLQPYLDASAKLIDRATILRLTAAKEQGQGGTLRPLAMKKVETDALVGYADVLIELLIARSPRSRYGYEFKATAKEVKTGALLANVTSMNWESEANGQHKVVADEHGYRLVDERRLPRLQDVSRTLALEMMGALARAWE